MLRNRPGLLLSAVLLLSACNGSSVPGGACTSDSNCASPTPRCDKNSGTCVPCLPTGNDCPSGKHCMASGTSYVCGGCVAASDCPTFGGGTTACCAGLCVEISSDPHNCAGCANNCPLLPAAMSASCTGGLCGIGACNPGFFDCNHNPVDGCEIDGQTNASDCGACGNKCTAGANQMTACVGGSCQPTCSAGWTHCSAKAADGCEVHTDVDLKNCGGCGTACGPLPNATAVCNSGNCNVGACTAPFADCDASAQNGCEVNLSDDAVHCGTCGTACPAVANGTPGCLGGACGVGKCHIGFADCDGVGLNGCETDLTMDVMNCGVCGNACVGPHSMQVCQASACEVAGCDAGRADCNRLPGDGCEVAIGTDINNCGMCGTVCAVPANATVGCASGMCGIGKCMVGFLDCNMTALDGCEINKLTDANNCGVCGNACVEANATAACAAGMCAVGLCNAGFGDCNKKPIDGCESNNNTDINNCSGCGKACMLANAVQGCDKGACTISSCNAGFMDCDGKVANGCESNLDRDPNNCGACGSVCPQNVPLCFNAACVATFSILMVDSSPYVDVLPKLRATGLFTSVDEFDVRAGTPTLNQLSAYGAVLVYSDGGFLDATEVGDVLADYYDQGGIVVLTVFADCLHDEIKGRFGDLGGPYMLITPEEQDESPDSLGVVAEPNSPLMTGVASLKADRAFKSPGAVINGGVVVASWAGGMPLVVRGTVNGRNIVTLNLYPVSGDAVRGGISGDAIQLVSNALFFQ